MKQFFLISFLFSIFALGACSGGAGLNLGQYPDVGATKDDFIYCHGYGCTKKIRMSFNNYEWKQISKIFKNKSKSAKDERIKIGKAMALMEKYTGELAGTQNDLPKAPLRRQSLYELDCIDETVNTSKYLKFLTDANLLKFHDVGATAFRGLNSGMYPHNTATVVEIKTGDVYVVDSYIYKNAVNPDIRLLESWRQYRIEELDKANNLSRL